MLFNMVLPGAVAAEEPFAFEYSGNFTDNRDADGKGTARLNTSGTLTVLSGKATVSVYILGAGGGGLYKYYSGYYTRSSGGGGGYQTVTAELSPGTYEIIIGTGGLATTANQWDGKQAGKGGDTTAFGYTSTGGTGGTSATGNFSGTGGKGGTPNGNDGQSLVDGDTLGGAPNGGDSLSGTPSPGGDGYVELTFI